MLKISLLNYLYKYLKIFRNRKPSFHYAEFGEDIFINRIFKNYIKGIYVDVGCYHPFKGSLTAKLYEKNWNGINIDISKTSIDLFNIVRKRDINLNYAISDFNGNTVFYENSPINQQNSLIKVNENQKEVKIECFTLNHILSENNIQKFDYLNIDVEGNELKVIKSIDLERYKPNLITVENNDLLVKDYLNSDIYKIFEKNNYILVNKIGVTNFFMPNNLAKNLMNLIKI